MFFELSNPREIFYHKPAEKSIPSAKPGTSVRSFFGTLRFLPFLVLRKFLKLQKSEKHRQLAGGVRQIEGL